MSDALFAPITVGNTPLKNRIWMAPLTRGRAQGDGTPTPIMATYYAQRASAGLIVTEATSISVQGRGWVNAPGIYTDRHVEAWKPVTDAVHAAGGTIFLQLWHMGRVSHPDFQVDGALPVGPSAIAAKGDSHTAEGRKPYVQPRALATDELPLVLADYVNGAKRAIAAGFDGVELHAANGYLLDQFIRDRSNQRTDAYGGSIENRWRFPLEVAAAVADAIGADRTGIRFSPTGAFNDMGDTDPIASFTYGATQLEAMGLAYIHLVDPVPGHMMAVEGAPKLYPHVRSVYSGTLVINGGYNAESANALVASKAVDAVTFGMPFLVNPDLVRRYREGITESNAPDFHTLYTPGEKGYTDYPALDDRGV